MSLDEDARAELVALTAAGRLRVGRVVEGVGPLVRVDGREVINASSNDYLDLARDPALKKAAKGALDEGVGAGASRLITGNHPRLVELEAAIGDWMRVDGVRVFTSGYAANIGVATALFGPGDVVFSDALNHASIIDGCRLSRAEIVVVPHRDIGALEQALATRRGRRRVVISETVFSMDGDVADVEKLRAICDRHDAALVLDEAHAMGVVGPEGRGVAAQQGVTPDVLVGTFGKALGTAGAFVATTRAIAEVLWNRARSFVYSTAMPASIAAATTAAIELVRGPSGDDRRQRLMANARLVRKLVPRLGGEGAIAPLLLGGDREVLVASEALFHRGVLAIAVRPPTVPVGTARLRITLSSGHTFGMIEQIATALAELEGREHRVA